MPEIPIAERVALLTRSEGWFGRAPREFQKAILAHCEWTVCSAGQPVYRTADERADLFAVVDGTVEIYSRFGIGDNPLLHLAHEGFWAGYGSVIAGEAPRATIIARVDTLLARPGQLVIPIMQRSQPSIEVKYDGKDKLSWTVKTYADSVVDATELALAEARKLLEFEIAG